MQICSRVIFRQQIKMFDYNNFTMSLMLSFQMHVPKKESCIYSIVQT